MLAALSLAIGLGALGLTTNTAADFSDGACPPGQGVTVVVQAEDQPVVRCAHGPPSTGLDATQAAGFAIQFVPGQPGFVCVIDAIPEPCNGAPASAYWSYWRADAGAWVYSTSGAGSDLVQVDDWVGWAFGAGVAPELPPLSPMPASSPDQATGPPEVSAGQGEGNGPDGGDGIGDAPAATTGQGEVNCSNGPDGIGGQKTLCQRAGPPWGLLAGLAFLLIVGGVGLMVVRRRR